MPEYGVVVPWGVTESELFTLIPAAKFKRSLGGWPVLHFTLLGVEGDFGFNFVTHPKGKLIKVKLANDETQLRADDRVWRSLEFTRLRRLLQRKLGRPTFDKTRRTSQPYLFWDSGDMWVDLRVEHGYYCLLDGEFTDLSLSVYARFIMSGGRM